ncbi:sortase [Burkholderia multivorans]|nr:sortase [Burkholderia multivorans]PRF40689.1 sortase [Burkholderia multivorans]PRG44689.1 sortase [Burkholderia multivorans]
MRYVRDAQDIHKLANTNCGEPASRGALAPRVAHESRHAAAALTRRGIGANSPSVSRRYSPHRRDIHRLANKICGQAPADYVASARNPARRDIALGRACARCPLAASAP